MWLGTAISHVRVLAFSPGSCLDPVSVNSQPVKHQMISQVLGSLSLMWKTWIEFLALMWSNAGCCWHLRSEPGDEELSVFKEIKVMCFVLRQQSKTLFDSLPVRMWIKR